MLNFFASDTIPRHLIQRQSGHYVGTKKWISKGLNRAARAGSGPLQPSLRQNLGVCLCLPHTTPPDRAIITAPPSGGAQPSPSAGRHRIASRAAMAVKRFDQVSRPANVVDRLIANNSEKFENLVRHICGAIRPLIPFHDSSRRTAPRFVSICGSPRSMPRARLAARTHRQTHRGWNHTGRESEQALPRHSIGEGPTAGAKRS